nr:unnamed protein product [Spirometra erinaceieuropaei]
MGFPSPMLLQAALILLVVSQGIEKICREDNKYCRPLPFTSGDDSKDAQCRRVCAKKRAERREEQLKAIFPDIQFTMEEEENNQLAFLDVRQELLSERRDQPVDPRI